MKRTRLAATILASAGLIAAGGGTAALASSTAPSARAASARAGSPARYVVPDCAGHLVVAPKIITITCADANTGLMSLHWTSWTSEMASAYGTFWENNCKPDCALGHIYHYPSRDVLWGSAAVKGHPGLRSYTKITVIFTGRERPPVYVRRNGKIVTIRPLTQTFPTP